MALETLIQGGSGNINTPPPTLNGEGFEGDRERMMAEVDDVLRASARQLEIGAKALEGSSVGIVEGKETALPLHKSHVMPEVLGLIAARRAVGVRYVRYN